MSQAHNSEQQPHPPAPNLATEAPSPASDLRFNRRVAQIGLPGVLYNPLQDRVHSVINLGNLHRMVLHIPQRQLLAEVAQIRGHEEAGGEQAERIRECLSEMLTDVDLSKKAETSREKSWWIPLITPTLGSRSPNQ